MGKLNRPKKYCECIDHCGTEIPLHCHFATGHQFRGATPHNKGKGKPIEYHLCECNQCDIMVPVGQRFAKGHGSRVTHWSKGPNAAEIRARLSVHASQRTGEKSGRFGKTKETNPAFSNSGVKKGTVPHNKDKKWEEYLSPAAITSIIAAKTGRDPWNKDIHGYLSAEALANMSREGATQSEEFKDNLSARMRTPENPWYVDGRSSGENRNYPLEFSKDLKEFIRDRDHRQCQICSKLEEENGQKLHVHHIDYDKKNLDPKNLVALCHQCHAKTNTKKNRPYWISFFKSQQNEQQTDFWLSSINQSTVGSGYIPDPIARQQVVSQQLSS